MAVFPLFLTLVAAIVVPIGFYLASRSHGAAPLSRGDGMSTGPANSN